MGALKGVARYENLVVYLILARLCCMGFFISMARLSAMVVSRHLARSDGLVVSRTVARSFLPDIFALLARFNCVVAYEDLARLDFVGA